MNLLEGTPDFWRGKWLNFLKVFGEGPVAYLTSPNNWYDGYFVFKNSGGGFGDRKVKKKVTARQVGRVLNPEML